MIKLFDDWVILVDAYNYTLAKDKGVSVDKDGKERHNYMSLSHHTSLAEALKALSGRISSDALQNGSHSLTEAVRIIQDSNSTVQKLYEEVLSELRL